MCFDVCMFLSKNSLGHHFPGEEGARSRAGRRRERDLRKGVAGGKGEMAWNLLSRPGWLTERPQGSCCVHLPSTEITRVCHHTWHFFFILSPFIEINFFSHIIYPDYGFPFLYSSQFSPSLPLPLYLSLVNKQAPKGK